MKTQTLKPMYRGQTDNNTEEKDDELYPGKVILCELMEPRNLKAADVAKAARMSPQAVSEILAGKRAITADTATRLGDCFDVTPMFFMTLQAQYELREVKRRLRGNEQSTPPILPGQ